LTLKKKTSYVENKKIEKKYFFFLDRDIATKLGGLLENPSGYVSLEFGVPQTPHALRVDNGRIHEKSF
jgi:hypothetical protein